MRERLKALKSDDLIPLIQPECKLSQKGLEAMPTEELAELVLAGITFTEAKEKGLLEMTIVGDPSDFCVKPLLNIIFTRDPGMCMGKSYIAGKMRWESRRGEVRVLVKALGIRPNGIVSAQGGYFEGGDHMPIGYGRLLMGFGTRSSALGVNNVIPKLEEKGDLEEAVLVRLETPELHPNKGIGHLDTVMGIPAKDVIIYYKSYIDRLKVYIYKKGKVTPDDRPLREVLKDYLASDLRVVTIGDDDYYAQEREHWLLASNILVVAKDTMIAYEHNRVTNKLAKEAGIEDHDVRRERDNQRRRREERAKVQHAALGQIRIASAQDRRYTLPGAGARPRPGPALQTRADACQPAPCLISCCCDGSKADP